MSNKKNKDTKKESKEKEEDILLTEEQYNESFERNKDLNIHERMHLVKTELKYIQKKGNTGQYASLEHDDVTEAVRKKHVKFGINSVIERIEKETHILKDNYFDRNANELLERDKFFIDIMIYMKYINVDNPEDFIISPSIAHGIDIMGNAPGKAISYAVKYNYVKNYELETGDEEDKQKTEDDNPKELINEIESLGKFLFEDDWEKMKLQKVNKATRGQTAEISRVPKDTLIGIYINLNKIKQEKMEEERKVEEGKQEKEKSAKEISDEIDDSDKPDILKEFGDDK